jgi:hypothetical protein
MGMGLLLGALASCHYSSDYTYPTKTEEGSRGDAPRETQRLSGWLC